MQMQYRRARLRASMPGWLSPRLHGSWDIDGYVRGDGAGAINFALAAFDNGRGLRHHAAPAACAASPPPQHFGIVRESWL